MVSFLRNKEDYRPMLTLTVKQKRLGPVLGGHPWVFSQGFVNIPEGLNPGEPVRLVKENNDFLALGYFSSYSQITVRVWGYDEAEKIDHRFFAKRIGAAYSLRERYIDQSRTNAYRLINGESDLLPGLIVDKYAGYLVIQFHTRGMESWKGEIIGALEDVIHPEGIYERSDVPVRRFDGLSDASGLLSGTVPGLVTIMENGLTFLVDVRHGQKTGFFLDQRDKRQALMKYAGNASVLNCFSYTGGFSVYALAGGAKHVVSVDTSETALRLAKENLELNGFDGSRCQFVCADVKSYLKNESDVFDVVILDPPAFIKDRKKKQEGLAGYKTINERAMRIVSEAGILLTCSCSAHLSLEDFRFLLSEAGGRSKRPIRILETYTHGIDHPRLLPFTEGDYLKCFIMEAG
jgi:23S rRNA (cytosine1962-C5)-methyltransferase